MKENTKLLLSAGTVAFILMMVVALIFAVLLEQDTNPGYDMPCRTSGHVEVPCE